MAKGVVGGLVAGLIWIASTIPVVAIGHQTTNTRGPKRTFVSPSGKFVRGVGIEAPLFMLFSNFGTAETNRYDCCTGWTISKDQSVAMPFQGIDGKNATRAMVAVGLSIGTNAIALSINEDSGGLPGDAIQSFVLTGLPAFGACCKVRAANTSIPLAAGQQYWVVVAPGDETTNAAWNLNNTDQTPQPFAFTEDGVWMLANDILSAYAVRGTHSD
jgi:hypothetical protein